MSAGEYDENSIRLLGGLFLVVALVLVYLGNSVIVKLSPFFLIPVLGSIISLFVGFLVAPMGSQPSGITGLRRSNWIENWPPDFVRTDSQLNPSENGSLKWNLITLTGLYFPSVTGFMAGFSRLPILKDPQQSIPLGKEKGDGVSRIGFSSSILCLHDPINNLWL